VFAGSLSALAAGLEHWRNRKNDGVNARRHKQNAIASVMDAVVLTKIYLYDREHGSEASRARERDIAQAWQRAAMAVREYDHQLYQSAQLKAMGWSDPRDWKCAKDREWAIQLDTIVAQCKWHQDNG
jgi:hypothetical protein